MSESKTIPVTAVFDIGKTNKKFLLFDDDYSVVFKRQTTLELTKDDDSFECEDLELLTDWIWKKFRMVLRDSRFRVRALNFSTYGASLVHLDDQGLPACPLYNYIKPYPEQLRKEFYDTYDGQEAFSIRTASPPMGMLNSGLQLYWLKYEKPRVFYKISHSLHFPQYLSYLFTGEPVSELTSIGCHTGLWDYEQHDYHPWVEREHLKKLLPPIQPVTAGIDCNFDGIPFKAGRGIHDSSAALAPYLFAFDEPFMLVSTGTWSITLNPFNKEPLSYDELQKDCLCYLNIYGEQVKASRLFLGNEFAHQKEKLDHFFGCEGRGADVELQSEVLQKLIREEDPRKKLVLETMDNSGPYPGKHSKKWQMDQFESYEEAYHQLMMDLVSIQGDCIELAQGNRKINKLIVTGGFSQNNLFVSLLASRFPGKEIYTTAFPYASALGAAMVISGNHGGPDLNSLLKLHRHEPIDVPAVAGYDWKRGVIS